MQDQDKPVGLCECGCGQPAPLWKEHRPSRGQVKGQPARFIHGHCRRAPDVQWTVDENDCWIWTGALGTGGYGRRYWKGRLVNAHRYTYERFKGPIPSDREIDHLCRVRACVNPEHLEAVTAATNSQRGSKARLDWATVTMIRFVRMTTSLSLPVIAEMCGVHNVTVWHIVHNRTWIMPQATPLP